MGAFPRRGLRNQLEASLGEYGSYTLLLTIAARHI